MFIICNSKIKVLKESLFENQSAIYQRAWPRALYELGRAASCLAAIGCVLIIYTGKVQTYIYIYIHAKYGQGFPSSCGSQALEAQFQLCQHRTAAEAANATAQGGRSCAFASTAISIASRLEQMEPEQASYLQGGQSHEPRCKGGQARNTAALARHCKTKELPLKSSVVAMQGGAVQTKPGTGGSHLIVGTGQPQATEPALPRGGLLASY